ncbi:hypothetical protein [Rhodococcus spelaei]|uniref:hypothetical protein n=1 Tax=Rhodococcus spelaei TaxID=2546320 RepID=UPI0015EE4D8A|nr:hypothetical protein [Rhodococcus spelaei]
MLKPDVIRSFDIAAGTACGRVDGVGSGRRVLLLGGRSWKVTHIDWNRRQVFVENTDLQGRAKWMSLPDGASFEITRGVRDVLLGVQPAGVTLARRAVATLDDMRLQRADHIIEGAFVIARDGRDDWRWWTWAGAKANRTPAAWAPGLVPPRQRIGAESLRLHGDLSVDDIRRGLAELRTHNGDRPLPLVDKKALKGLKFRSTPGGAGASLARRPHREQSGGRGSPPREGTDRHAFGVVARTRHRPGRDDFLSAVSDSVLFAARRTSAVIHGHGHAPTRTTRFVLPGGPHFDLASYVGETRRRHRSP